MWLWTWIMNAIRWIARAIYYLWQVIGVIATILGIISFFYTRDEFYDLIAKGINSVFPSTPIAIVDVDPDLKNVIVYPKFKEPLQGKYADLLTKKLITMGLAARGLEEATPASRVCQSEQQVTLVFHDKTEELAANKAAAKIGEALKLMNLAAAVPAVVMHPEPSGRYTPFRFYVCVAGIAGG